MCPPSARPSRRVACLHCGLRAGHSGRRNLCYPCWRHLPTRLKYPVHARGHRQEVPDLSAGQERPLPTRYTAARPGSPKKCGILQSRLAKAISLHHPLDHRIMPGPGAIERARALFVSQLGLDPEGEEE